jgi:hypothetical protein
MQDRLARQPQTGFNPAVNPALDGFRCGCSPFFRGTIYGFR